MSISAVFLLSLSGCATPSGSSLEAPLRSPPAPLASPLLGPMRMIVVDAGHGGHDPGTSHFGLKEKQMALDIARRLRVHLQQLGFTVVMTRETDHFIPLSRRPAVANRLGADLFVSVHINANRSSRVSGIEVYYPRESVISATAQWPPDVQPSEVAVPSTVVRQTLWDLVLRQARARSRRLGLSVCRAMREALQGPCRGVKGARFVVLREAWMPAVLVEVGYVTNHAEAKRLRSTEYREAAARGIANGILGFVRGQGTSSRPSS